LTTSLLVGPALGDVPTEKREPLTLANVLTLVLTRSPELAAFGAEVRAREARALQAGLLPNPELRTEVENVGGSGDRQGFEETETTVGLAQRLELGGKRGRRRRVARLGADLAGWDYETKKLAVLGAATKAFVRALAARERVRLAIELERIARSGVAAVGDQIAAGAAPVVELARARVTAGRSEVARQRAERDLAAAEAALAATWGDDRLDGRELAGDLTAPRRLPALAAIEADAADAPDLARWETELEERRAAVALEETARVPDVTVGAGGRHFSDNGDNALVFDLSVPLPVFDRNQGGIAEATHRLEKARAERAAAAAALRTAIAAAHAELAAAHEEATRLRDDVIPEAQRAFDGARAAFRQGALRAIDVLDAQRTLFDLRADYVTALETFHVQAAELERLTGGSPFEPRTNEEGR
jgi:cobalt-zinc-cadmium efflux system outer membrane protein